MKQTNSSLRQALEGGIDPLRPPEVRGQEGLALEVAEKGACHFHTPESEMYCCLPSRPIPNSTLVGPLMNSFWPCKVGWTTGRRQAPRDLCHAPSRSPVEGRSSQGRLTLSPLAAIRRYGRDFGAVAEVIGNKTLTQVKTFFVSYRRRFNLEEVL